MKAVRGETTGDHMPYHDHNHRADERANKRYTEQDIITHAFNNNDIGHHPHTNESKDDGPNDAKGHTPAYNSLRYQTDYSSNQEIQQQIECKYDFILSRHNHDITNVC